MSIGRGQVRLLDTPDKAELIKLQKLKDVAGELMASDEKRWGTVGARPRPRAVALCCRRDSGPRFLI